MLGRKFDKMKRKPELASIFMKHQHHCHNHNDHKPHSPKHAHNRIGVALLLNFSFACLELIGGIVIGSSALVANSLHDFGDSASIVIAYVLEKLSKREADQRFSYGYRRLSLLSAIIMGVILIVGAVFMITHAAEKIFSPPEFNSDVLLYFAIAGIAINAFGARALHKGHSANEKIISWHFIEDLLAWSATLIAALCIKFLGWYVLDPILSIAISIFVLYRVISLSWNDLKVFLQGVPTSLQQEKILHILKHVPDIHHIHNLHIWSMDGEHHVVTMHVALKGNPTLQELEKVKSQIQTILSKIATIHLTVEFEAADADCANPSPFGNTQKYF